MKKYYGIDWLRALACIGIMAMHMAANNNYTIDGFFYQRMIPSFTDFVFLFMAISAFGMCCGYFDKVMSGKVNWTAFYKKRYTKILPFFLLLILIDLGMNFSLASLYEGLTEITLLHGLIPNSLTVIGVGWFLGIVFLFYLIFPFYCVLMEKKSRAWIAFAISVGLNYICTAHFGLGRTNFLYCFCYFIAGGLVYLYRDRIAKGHWYVYLPFAVAAVVLYYLVGETTAIKLFVTIALLVFAISLRCGRLRIVAFLSDISMEFYLSHMLVFRAIEILHLNTRFGSGWGQYSITVSLVLIGTIVFSFGFQKLSTLFTTKK